MSTKETLDKVLIIREIRKNNLEIHDCLSTVRALKKSLRRLEKVREMEDNMNSLRFSKRRG